MVSSRTDWEQIAWLYRYAAGGRGLFGLTAQAMMDILPRVRETPAVADVLVTTSDLALTFRANDGDDAAEPVILHWHSPGRYAIYIGKTEPPYYDDMQMVLPDEVEVALTEYLNRLATGAFVD
ncbi:MAG: hypothetical protein JW910_04020 [Anaerolineae bacterium]|nr:hypothetical protein [Anaerolineae bacterium]